MAYTPPNPNGQAAMAASAPVVIANNQSAIPVTLTSTTITGTVAVTQSGSWSVTQSGTWNVGTVTNLSQLGGAAISMNSGVRDAGTQRVTIATNDSVPVTGPLTDTQLRASAVPVSLASVPTHAVTLTSTTITGTVAVSGPLTDAQLRASAVPVSGTVTIGAGAAAIGSVSVSNFPATQAISAASLPLPAGAATETTLAAVNAKLPAAAASADGMANPTISQMGAELNLFNGVTWDRQRGNYDQVLGVTGAKTASFTTSAITNYNCRGALITAAVSAVSGTTPTMSITIDISYDGGTTWLVWMAPVSANLTAAGTLCMMIYPTNMSAAGPTPAAMTLGSTITHLINAPLPRLFRARFAIAGTTPSFTFTNVYVNFML